MTLGFPAASSPAANRDQRRRDSPVFSTDGMIASAHPLISATGLEVLANGGNAVDAAVAAALVGNVVLPYMCGIGGDLFAIVSRPGGELLSFMSSGIGPTNTSLEFMIEHGQDSPTGQRIMAQNGPLAPAVPGMVSGAYSLLESFGTKSFAELAQPAINYAGNGFPLTIGNAQAIANLAPLLSRFPTSAAIFLPGGAPLQAGEVLRQTDLAATISQIASEGCDAFYKGDIARRIGEFLTANGGVLSADDFADHTTDIAPPLATTYRDYTIYETKLPTQGFVVLEALNILEAAGLSGVGPLSAAGVHLQIEALKLAFADRLAFAGDPRVQSTPMETLLSKEWALGRAGAIDRSQAAASVAAGELNGGDTTYLCVTDRDGLMISLIFSLSAGFGSGVVAGDTGVMLNNRAGHCFSLTPGHPNLFAPGKKTMHTLNCYLIADPSGTPIIVGGTPGGDYQPQWNVQTITNMIDGGMDVQAAIDAPRWIFGPGTYPIEVGEPFEVGIEKRAGSDVISELRALGHTVTELGDWSSGAVQIISRDPETGVLTGGSDPRVEGLVVGR